MNNNFGLSPEELKLVLLAINHFSQIEKCVIFGSRAMGNYKKGSDIDIAVFGKEINSLQILRLSSMLNECFPIPFSADIVHYDKLTHKALKEHINKNGVILYERPPLVSVLMTVYNREKYIAEAIESVLASSYTNFELIIVDDQSTDQSVEIARKYQQQDSRITVYVNEKNLGDYPNRNKAASYAKGKYIKYLDADDKIYWYGLEEMVKAMEQYPDSVVGLSHSKPDELKPYPFELKPAQAYEEHFLGRGVFNYGPTGLIFRRDIFEKEKGFLEKQYISDTEFLLRLGAKYPIIKMAPALAWWRQHEEQQIVTERQNISIFVQRYLLNISYLHAATCPLNEKQKKEAINRVKQHYARKLLALALVQKQINQAKQAYLLSELTFWELLKGLKSYS